LSWLEKHTTIAVMISTITGQCRIRKDPTRPSPKRSWASALGFACIASVALATSTSSCKPSSVDEAERKGNVDWLATNATPGAIEALGRLADTDSKALAVVQEHAAKHNIGAYMAAWSAHLRGVGWGATLLRAGLAEASGAELAAAAMTRRDTHLVEFVPDFENAMVRMGSSSRASVISGVLASLGKQASTAIERRLLDSASRGTMCRGLTSSDADPEVRALLFSVAPAGRDDSACVTAVMMLAASDDSAFQWLLKESEPGMIRAASRPGGLSCDKVRVLWGQIFGARDASAYPSLTVPLSDVLKRCPKEVDDGIASTLRQLPAAQIHVINAVDPYGGALAIMTQTCRQLAALGQGNLPPLVRARASDAYSHGCLGSH
jgi:hypothetical protein